ncbi:hypothetical protein TD95_001684 [Thielaviopsis punctulata]|uniref:Probable cytosolic iron-sulfur protein assembly protein 1 n=1 Tax=Thielaviopsis punctulata TaxID=72032 RepID=A0A0F4ZG21_9PEZI|nr:hypothetical protein TD95_001684 [Thielaviopsis punctulata]
MAPSSDTPQPQPLTLSPLPVFSPDLYERAWCSIPHPTLPLLATAHAKNVTIFSLATMTKHSVLSGGHSRSIRSLTWKPNLGPAALCLATGSFDSTAGLWRWEDAATSDGPLEREVTRSSSFGAAAADDDDHDDKEWEFTLVLEGHDSEIKSVQFSPSGVYLATCSRDKTVWIWEDIGASEGDDEWETVAVLNEHEADVKAVAWCPDVPGRNARRAYSADVLASASYDNTVRIWREDADGEWVCVAVLDAHEATVWGLQWEARPRTHDRFPRLLTFSADCTVRIWELREDDALAGDNSDTATGGFGAGLGSIPNTMRQALRETWSCTAVLPRAHTREIYAATWSAQTGRVATTGGDGRVVVYEEVGEEMETVATATAAAESAEEPGAGRWRVVGSVDQAHGAYEVNHVTWSRRFDRAAVEAGSVQEMLVTTGDDGIVRPWAVESTVAA